jgi:hypothetical protein
VAAIPEELQLVRCESRDTVSVARGQFGNPGRGMSAVGSSHQRIGEGQKTEKTQSSVVNCRLCEVAKALGFTQPLTEMSKVRPVHRADNLTAICEPIV